MEIANFLITFILSGIVSYQLWYLRKHMGFKKHPSKYVQGLLKTIENKTNYIRRLSRPVYLCIGGYVTSRDGDQHYISGHKLPDLYNIPIPLCKIINHAKDLRGIRKESYIILHPRSDGNYKSL